MIDAAASAFAPHPKIGRGTAPDVDECLLCRVDQAKTFRVELVARVSWQSVSRFAEHAACGEQWISNQGVTCRRKVNSDLVGPSRFDLNFEQGSVAAAFKDSDPAEGGFPGCAGRMNRSKLWMGDRPYGCFDGEGFTRWRSGGKCAIDFDHPVLS